VNGGKVKRPNKKKKKPLSLRQNSVDYGKAIDNYL
jgi:hypothetical protein